MKKLLLSLTAFCILGIVLADDRSTALEIKKLEVAESISEDELMSYVHDLVDPQFKGRRAGSPGYMMAAQHVAGLLQSWGVEPLGDDGSYYQHFEWPFTDVFSTGSVSLFKDDQTLVLSAPDDFYPGASSDSGTLRAEMVFVGYGISAAELGYDDYSELDVAGKIVMIGGGTPYNGKNIDSLNLWGPYSGGNYKAQNAHDHGAKGVVFMDKIANPGLPYFAGFYYAHLDAQVCEKILGKAVEDMLKGIKDAQKPDSFPTGFEIEISADTQHYGMGKTANVIGYIPGTDEALKHEAIILGAHLDAQGYLGFELPGALDNASGVADILAVARALSQFKGELKRSVVFLFFAAEEVGLVGSKHYCEHPAFAPEQTLLFMNLDMVGNGKGLALWHGESYPEIYSHFSRNNEAHVQRSLKSSEGAMPVGRPRTDGLVFMLNGFRTFHVGTTDRVNPMYYHHPGDTAENLVPDIMRDVSRMLFLGIVDLANDSTIRSSEMFLIQ